MQQAMRAAVKKGNIEFCSDSDKANKSHAEKFWARSAEAIELWTDLLTKCPGIPAFAGEQADSAREASEGSEAAPVAPSAGEAKREAKRQKASAKRES